MNRIILIGNGFDLAHDLKTSYKNFIDSHWDQKRGQFIKHCEETQGRETYEDPEIQISNIVRWGTIITNESAENHGYKGFLNYMSMKEWRGKIKFTSAFLEQITKKQHLQNWVDIEEEYYLALNECLENSKRDIEKLNSEFLIIQQALEMYLSEIQKENTKDGYSTSVNIDNIIYSELKNDEFLRDLKTSEGDIHEILFLSFNYTTTEKRYPIESKYTDRFGHTYIHIHGELNNPDNPIVFGYGDEIDEKYKIIENKNNNLFLQNIKSIKYLETGNLKKLLRFINSDCFQVFIMGHSCGISDRTLLNTLFEHDNCQSIKVFFHKKEDGSDNFSDVIRNISRNFNNKAKMRERVVPKEYSKSL